ncbi:Homeobox-leucine zipper protein 4 / HD-ZIP protein [Hibiscus syriacus]|uniref:Homeobox-leucine zipper protein 4 / HD-ZIP protein n=1 Tax=Hibiscus syriacus TaxID=106335 RepID=A0A6A2YIC5_HIBSY|nr:hepatoma-derived growth factor-related protein 2-like [Hibiscus syriacus]KAE8678019.1 Homeobox-leucine zipper protein 4 / HD-ZIP protein [Hibiscus syriacus]
MADTDSHTKEQQLIKEQNPAHPIVPSQAPEFINQTLLNRSWELLRLLFVGIAVSYGLFSRRNDETDKEIINNNNCKLDNLQSLMSRFLQVSAVFDDEAENISGSDECKVHTWSSQYYRIEPPVLVAKKQGEEKPLLLPVRSLKSRVLEGNNGEQMSGSLRRSNSSLSSKRENGKTLAEKLNDSNVVLPSPIPWLSRSGRMEVKEDTESFRPQTTRLSRSKSSSFSPKKLSPSSTSSLTEIQAKTSEDLVRKKTIYKSPPPPPPPPPPTPLVSKPSPLNGSFKPKPKQRFMVVETTAEDDDSNNEEDNGADGGSDVDKKADEFIAKVREQIRLQRIDSIKRSSGHVKRNSTT